MMKKIVVATLYRFVSLPEYQELRQPLIDFCERYDIKGTILLAQEGINGTVAASRESIDELFSYLHGNPKLSAINCKESLYDEPPFYRMKVKLKQEIVTMGIEGIDPNKVVGSYVKAQDWNTLIDDPEVLVVDTRNYYEVAIGTFKGAQDPLTTNFREFPRYVAENLDPEKHKKLAMFCTCGIRCEKSTNYLIGQGVEDVYHLKGGILKYLEDVPADESTWDGSCFVFDARVSVGHGLEEGPHILCYACRQPLLPDRQSFDDRPDRQSSGDRRNPERGHQPFYRPIKPLLPARQPLLPDPPLPGDRPSVSHPPTAGTPTRTPTHQIAKEERRAAF